MSELPVSHVLPELLQTLEEQRVAVLKAPPGAGKTTGVPPAILDRPGLPEGKILLVQPRRLAARSAASRLASLCGQRIGQSVGYHVRFDRQVGVDTRLISMTTGILLRRMSSDPLLESVSCVILDEFHERSLDVDLALGMLQRIRTTLRPELNLVVMSATMDPQPLLDLIDDAVAIESEGRSYEVQLHYAATMSSQPVEDQVVEAAKQALDQTDGHLLVFLPGVGEIKRTHQRLMQSEISDAAMIHELYGDLSPGQQDVVLRDASGRKIILATNVAETSVTIPGVTGVIDSGLARVLRYDDRVGLPELRLEPISQASADQRAGRAGRTAPGQCWRLWPANTHHSRPRQTPSEIQRTDFCSAALTLSAWGERDWLRFPWVTPPRAEAIEAARKLLIRLGGIDESNGITEIGQQMVAMPLHPRLSRLLLAAQQRGVSHCTSIAAALLSERNPFSKDTADAVRVASGGLACDLTIQVARLISFSSGDRAEGVHHGAAHHIVRVAKNLRCHLGNSVETSEWDTPADPRFHEAFARSLIAAFPDRVARRRTLESDRGVMVGGRGVRIGRRSHVTQGELLLCLDADSQGQEAMVRMACGIESSWLPTSLVRNRDELLFHDSLQAVVARRRVHFDDLLLSESPVECRPSPAAGALLAAHSWEKVHEWLSAKESTAASFVARLKFIAEHPPSPDFPLVDESVFKQIHQQLSATRLSVAELLKAPWLDHLRGHFSYEQLRKIDHHAPERISVPSGNQIAIRYEPGKPPTLAVRIQELFGWSDTPTVAGGRVPIQLHLLGPNRRPQQITDDLASFWQTTYTVVRKELKRRYPKHHWPEDPIHAKATHNGLKPR